MRKALLAIVGLAVTVEVGSLGAGDWLQFQYDAASQGRAPRAVEPPFQLRWVWYGEENVAVGGKPFPSGHVPRPPRDSVGLLSFTMHGVVADGRVVFGDLEGKLYCLSARDGSTVWKKRFPGAFVHAAAIYRPDAARRPERIVAPCQDGRLYGLDWDGEASWRVEARRPFVAAAKIGGRTAYAGSLDGVLYAVDVSTGEVRWTFDAGAPIRQPAAIALGRVFFGSEDMVFHALDASSGESLWKTTRGQMRGQSFRNTWPDVVGDRVMTFQILVDGLAEYIMETLLFNATPGDHEHKRLEDWPRERQAILGWLSGDMTYAADSNKYWQKDPGKFDPARRSPRWAGGPLRKSFFVFDVAGDGEGGALEPFQVPMGIVGGTGNSNMGPVLDAEGRPITWWRVSARSIIPGGSFGTAFSPDLSALDLRTGDRIILPTELDIHRGGPGMELDNHHMLSSAGDYIYYHNPFRQARWVRLDGKTNPAGKISAVYAQHDGGGWNADVVYYPTKKDAGERAARIFDTHGAARTPIVIADDALFVNELDIRAFACYESRSTASAGRPPEQAPDSSRPGPPTAESRRAPETPEFAEFAESETVDANRVVWEKRVVSDIEGGEARWLRRELEEQIQLVLDAGHLLPYYCKRGELDPRWYFTNPGDTIATLARAFPHLDTALRERTREYMDRELATYPPSGPCLNAPGDPGTSRMSFEVPEDKREWNGGRLYASLPRVHNIYSLWLHADATGDLSFVKRHWKEILAFYESQKADVKAYFGGVGAPIGLARLAHRLGDDATRKAAEADALAALSASSDVSKMRDPMFVRHGFRERWHAPFLFKGFHMLHLAPELARYIRGRPAIRRQVLEQTATATSRWPMWFISQASCFTRYYGESHAISPLYSKMIFPVKALIESATPERLRVWVDAEDAPLGDLFFIERLVLALEACGEERWVDVR